MPDCFPPPELVSGCDLPIEQYKPEMWLVTFLCGDGCLTRSQLAAIVHCDCGFVDISSASDPMASFNLVGLLGEVGTAVRMEVNFFADETATMEIALKLQGQTVIAFVDIGAVPPGSSYWHRVTITLQRIGVDNAFAHMVVERFDRVAPFAPIFCRFFPLSVAGVDFAANDLTLDFFTLTDGTFDAHGRMQLAFFPAGLNRQILV